MLSMMSSQLKVSNAVSIAVSSAAGSRYGRPPTIAFAKALDAQHASTSRSASWAGAASDQVRQGLTEGNLAYEKRFGHIFLICASGLSGQEMLTQLQARRENDQDTERAVVRAELLKITRLRMTKRLGL